jgi:CcmD family protein
MKSWRFGARGQRDERGIMQPTLTDLLVEIRNLSYFFVGFAVIWASVLGFAFLVARRGKDLRAEIDELKKALNADARK